MKYSLKGSLIASGLIGVLSAGVFVLDIAAKRHAKIRAHEKAIELRSADQVLVFEEAQKRCDIFKKMTADEKKAIDAKIKNWKMANEFERRKADILAGVEDGLREFKANSGYFDKMEELEENFEAGIEAFKNSIDYDAIKSKMEEDIKEAKKHYEQQKAAFDLAGDDISETTMKLRHAAEEAMNTKVKEAKEKIAALDKQLEIETDKLKKIKLDGTKSLEEKVAKEKIRLSKKQDKELEKLNLELENATNDIHKKVRKARTEEQVTAAANHENDICMIREQKALDANVASDILDKMPRHVRFAEFLKAKHVPRWLLMVAGIVPLLLFSYILATLWIFLHQVSQAMVMV